MTIINFILITFNKAKNLINLLQNIEKNKIINIKNEANNLFHVRITNISFF